LTGQAGQSVSFFVSIHKLPSILFGTAIAVVIPHSWTVRGEKRRGGVVSPSPMGRRGKSSAIKRAQNL
jgi:hypothetical protein